MKNFGIGKRAPVKLLRRISKHFLLRKIQRKKD
nr:MAG TPA: hypothetical protein [Caudoviricetes sp.]